MPGAPTADVQSKSQRVPDTVEPSAKGPYPSSLEARVSRLEEEQRDMRGSLARLELAVARIEAMLAATLPHLATKAEMETLRAELRAELAEKPSKAYLWLVLGVLVTAILGSFGAGLAAISILH